MESAFRQSHAPRPAAPARVIVPAVLYVGQWIWDTMFVVGLLLALLPDRKRSATFSRTTGTSRTAGTDGFEHARNMITVAIKTESQEVRQFSQIPVLAWGVERVFKRNREQQLLGRCLAGPNASTTGIGASATSMTTA